MDETCNLRVSRPRDTYIRLRATNSWIFFTTEPTIAHIICNDSTSTAELSGSSLLNVHVGCTVTTGIAIIPAENTYQSQVIRSFQSYFQSHSTGTVLPKRAHASSRWWSRIRSVGRINPTTTSKWREGIDTNRRTWHSSLQLNIHHSLRCSHNWIISRIQT